MKTYTLQIVEDDSLFSDLLEAHLKENCPSITHIGTSKTVEKSMLLFLKHKPDILLLDIQLGERESFSFLEQVDLNNTILIFISSHKDYAIESIKFQPFGFLLKPLVPEELDILFLKAFSAIDKERETQLIEGKLEIVSKKKIDLIPYKNILYIEADGAYCDIYYDDKICTVSLNLSALEQKLPLTYFIRIHSKYIVNKLAVNSIHRLNGIALELNNSIVIPVSRRRVPEVLSKIK